MAFSNPKFTFTFTAASAVAANVPVKIVGNETVVPAGTTTEDVVGVTIAAQPSYGGPVPVVVNGIAKCIAGASLGAGARVAAGSDNGVLAPIAAAGVASGAPAAAIAKYTVGRALTNAAADDVFSVLLQPEQIV